MGVYLAVKAVAGRTLVINMYYAVVGFLCSGWWRLKRIALTALERVGTVLTYWRRTEVIPDPRELKLESPDHQVME